MKANNFVKNFGWEYAKHILSDDAPLVIKLNYTDLKRLVKSQKLVESYGGLEKANRIICDAYKGSIYPIPKGHEELSLAIQDVESCM